MRYERAFYTFLRVMLLVAVVATCTAQCWEDIPLIRKDTVLGQGMFVIEPKPGQIARVVFEDIPATVHENFLTFGKWEHPTNTSDPFLNNDVYYSNEVGATLAVNIYGRRFEIVTATASHHGQMTVQLNSGPEVVVDLYSQQRVNESIVFDSPAPIGTNTVKIKVTGQRNPAATGTWVVVDYIRVYQ